MFFLLNISNLSKWEFFSESDIYGMYLPDISKFKFKNKNMDNDWA